MKKSKLKKEQKKEERANRDQLRSKATGVLFGRIETARKSLKNNPMVLSESNDDDDEGKDRFEKNEMGKEKAPPQESLNPSLSSSWIASGTDAGNQEPDDDNSIEEVTTSAIREQLREEQAKERQSAQQAKSLFLQPKKKRNKRKAKDLKQDANEEQQRSIEDEAEGNDEAQVELDDSFFQKLQQERKELEANRKKQKNIADTVAQRQMPFIVSNDDGDASVAKAITFTKEQHGLQVVVLDNDKNNNKSSYDNNGFFSSLYQPTEQAMLYSKTSLIPNGSDGTSNSGWKRSRKMHHMVCTQMGKRKQRVGSFS